MNKHTPGPWEWQTSCSFRRLGNNEGDGNVLYASVHRLDGQSSVEFPNGGFTGPDAKLIAAAPELLEALKLAQNFIGFGGITDMERKVIEDAITKATT
jgi:hypothetical protein